MSTNTAALSNQLVYGHDAEVGNWVAGQLGLVNPHPSAAIGIIRDNKFIGGVLYNNFYINGEGRPISIEISLAMIDKRWASRHTIAQLLEYPFIQLNLERVQSTVSKRDKNVRRILDKLGFKLEGIGRKAWHKGGDCAVYSMLRHECHWLKGNKNWEKIVHQRQHHHR